jgi:hypothetical protein
MPERARASKRIPITRHNGFVIFPAGSAGPLIAVTIATGDLDAFIDAAPRVYCGRRANSPARDRIPGFGIDAFIMGGGLQAGIRCFGYSIRPEEIPGREKPVAGHSPQQFMRQIELFKNIHLKQ